MTVFCDNDKKTIYVKIKYQLVKSEASLMLCDS